MEDKRTPKEFALEAIKKGTSVIPVGRDKKPLIQWKDYQERLATEEEVNNWWEQWPEANVGIVTGKISDLVVVDVEKGGDKSIFPETLTIKTGGDGWHLYYRYYPIQNKTRFFPLTDVRGEGGYVVAPTSTHSSGKKYEILEKKPIVPFPATLFGEKKTSEWKTKLNTISVGSRNTDFTSIIGGLIKSLPQDDFETIGWSLVESKNKTLDQPLNERELRISFLSVVHRELAQRTSGGEIRAIDTEILDDEINIKVTLEKTIICFKVKNLVSNLAEANIVAWLQKASGLTNEINFRLKINSDTSKEQAVRMLKVFDNKENKEVYQWLIIVNKLCSTIDKIIKDKKQLFWLPEITPKQTTWVYEPFIQEDQINTFFGMGGSCKTLLALYFSTIVASKGTKVMLVDYENDGSSWADKIKKMSSIGDEMNYAYYDTEHIPLVEQVDKIKSVIKTNNIKLVIIDSASMATGSSTSDEQYVLRFISALKQLRTTVVVIAHQRKNDGEKTPIGSIQFENQARNVWNFKSEVDNYDNSVLHVACTHTKANNTFIRKTPICFKVAYGEKIDITNEDAIENFSDKLSHNERIADFLRNNAGSTSKDISDGLDISYSTIRKELTKGKGKGQFKNNEHSLWFLEGQEDDTFGSFS